MKPIEIISQDVFDKIRSRFKNLEMGDETGAVTIDPGQARFFDFDFIIEGNDLGRVSISLNDIGTLKIFYSQGITENKDDMAKKLWFSFLKEMRMFAMRRLLRFDTRDITKSNLDKNDFQYLANKGAQKDEEMKQMNESKWNHRRTKKTSRAISGKTQIIVRHKKPVEDRYPGERSQIKNIEAIYVESGRGERFLYPFIDLLGARAMAQHVEHGGLPHDAAGKAIIKMSEETAQLQEFHKHVRHSQLHDDAMNIAHHAQHRFNELRKTMAALGKRHHYESWAAEFKEKDDLDGLVQLDDATLEDYKSKFTQTNFQEELSQFFPLIHKIMSETNSVDLEEYVSEGEECDKCHKDPCECDENVDESVDDFKKFEMWAEAMESGDLTPDQKANLKAALDNLQQTGIDLDLETAYNFFAEAGLENKDLEDKFDAAAEQFPDMEPMDVFKSWAKEQGKEDLLDYLGLTMPEEQPPAEPAAETPPAEPAAAAPEQPAAPAPAPQMTAENEDMKGIDPGTLEESNKVKLIKEVAKIVNQFYNREHKEQGLGPFPKGQEGICLEVEKRIAEKFGEKAGQHAGQLAEKFMEKIAQKDKMSGPVDDDGLQRLKELTKFIKAKVETMGGDIGDGSKAFTNIMPAYESNSTDMAEIRRLAGLAK